MATCVSHLNLLDSISEEKGMGQRLFCLTTLLGTFVDLISYDEKVLEGISLAHWNLIENLWASYSCRKIWCTVENIICTIVHQNIQLDF